MMQPVFWGAGVLECWSIGKYQIPNNKSQGVRFWVSGKINIEAET